VVVQAPADLDGGLEDSSQWNEATEFVGRYRRQSHGRDAPA